MPFTEAHVDREKLQKPIRTQAELEAAFKMRYTLRSATAKLGHIWAGEESTYQQEPAAWWAIREQARIDLGIYLVTDVLSMLNRSQHGFFVHVSTDDQSMVAYTPSREAGEQDKQIRTTLGKLLVKHFPLYTDDYVRHLVEEHQTDLSTAIEWLTTGEEFEAAYLSSAGKENDGAARACMSKEFRGVHPTRVYEGEGVRLAVLRDSEGVVIARSFVRESEKSKGFIRCYGNPKLHKLLTRMGYVPTNWIGAKFKTIKVQGGYAMPYIDGNATRGGEDVSTVAMIGNEIFVLDREQRRVLALNNGHYYTATSTDGYLSMQSNSTTAFSFFDLMTGEAVNELTLKAAKTKMYRDQKHGFTLKTESELAALGYVLTRTDGWAPLSQTFERYGQRYAELPANRQSAGFAYLSKRYYPDLAEKDRWTTQQVYGVYIDSTAEYVLTSDTIIVLERNSHTDAIEKTYQHKSILDRTYVKLHNEAPKKPNVYTKSLGEVVTTDTGRKVMLGYHSVTKLWNGAYAFTRSARALCIGGVVYHYRGTRIPAPLQVGSPFWEAELAKQYGARHRSRSSQASREPEGLLTALIWVNARDGIRFKLSAEGYRLVQPSDSQWQSERGVRTVHQFMKDMINLQLEEDNNSAFYAKAAIKWLKSIGMWDQEYGPIPPVHIDVLAEPGEVSSVPYPLEAIGLDDAEVPELDEDVAVSESMLQIAQAIGDSFANSVNSSNSVTATANVSTVYFRPLASATTTTLVSPSLNVIEF